MNSKPTPKTRFLIILFWLSLGMTVASLAWPFMGMPVEGDGTVWLVIFSIVSCFVSTGLFVAILTQNIGGSLKSLRRLEETPGVIVERAVARVEKLEEAGVVMRNFNHLFTFTVTVFPETGEPYTVTFKQFITMGELPNYYTGRYIVIGFSKETPDKPIIDKEPSDEWKTRLEEAEKKYKGKKATRSSAFEEKPLFESGKQHSVVKFGLNLGITATLFVAGFLGTVALSPLGLERFFANIAETPARISGNTQGLFESSQLESELAILKQKLGDRKILALRIYDDYIKIEAVSQSDPEGEDSYDYRAGSLSRGSGSSLSPDAAWFTMNDVSAEMIKKAAAATHAKLPGKKIVYIGYGMRSVIASETRGISGIDMHDERAIREAFEKKILRLTVTIDGEYGSKSLDFDPKTGEEE